MLGDCMVTEITIEQLNKLPIDHMTACQWRFWVFISGGALGWRHFYLGGHTTNTFVLNYRVCNRLYQIINIKHKHKQIH